jgi:predicted glutamine amidotransferase
MCIAILNTEGTLSKKTLKTCFENNPDGAGFAFSTGSDLVIFKELKKFDLFYSEYRKARQENKGANFLIHFRIRTHGSVSLNNCHPFKVNRDTCFIHNGMIDISTKGDLSDTYVFNEMILKKLPSDFTTNESILTLLETFIGYSKVVLLNTNNSYVILNESLGHWQGNNWFSNYSYQNYQLPEQKVTINDKRGKGSDYFDPCCDYCGYWKDVKVNEETGAMLCSKCEKAYKENWEDLF